MYHQIFVRKQKKKKYIKLGSQIVHPYLIFLTEVTNGCNLKFITIWEGKSHPFKNINVHYNNYILQSSILLGHQDWLPMESSLPICLRVKSYPREKVLHKIMTDYL